jgi:hypothetical protein
MENHRAGSYKKLERGHRKHNFIRATETGADRIEQHPGGALRRPAFILPRYVPSRQRPRRGKIRRYDKGEIYRKGMIYP